jgi:hypothetical protein
VSTRNGRVLVLVVAAVAMAVGTACGSSDGEVRRAAAEQFSFLNANPRPDQMAAWQTQLTAITFPESMASEVRDLVAAAAAFGTTAPCRHIDPVSCTPITAHNADLHQQFRSAYAVVRHDLGLPAQ